MKVTWWWLTLVCVVLTPQLALAARRVNSQDLPAEVMEIINNEVSSRFEGAIILELHQSSEFSDAGIYDLPAADWDYFSTLDDSVEVVGDNELGILFPFTNPKHFDQKFTHGSKKMDDLLQYLLRGARQDASIRSLHNTVAAERSLPGFKKAVLWVKIKIPRGGFNPVRRDIVYRPELADSMAALRQQMNGIDDRSRQALKTANEAKRLAQGAFGKHDVGLDVFPGVLYAKTNHIEYNGVMIGAGMRFRSIYIEYYTGKRFSDSQHTVMFGQETPIPTFSNDHFDGGGFYWVSPINDQQHNLNLGNDYGYFYRIGFAGMHLQMDNILNQSSTDSYLAGVSLAVAVPIKYLTPEISGNIGYARTVEAQPVYGLPNRISTGLGYSGRINLAIGYR